MLTTNRFIHLAFVVQAVYQSTNVKYFCLVRFGACDACRHCAKCGGNSCSQSETPSSSACERFLDDEALPSYEDNNGRVATPSEGSSLPQDSYEQPRNGEFQGLTPANLMSWARTPRGYARVRASEDTITDGDDALQKDTTGA